MELGSDFLARRWREPLRGAAALKGLLDILKARVVGVGHIQGERFVCGDFTDNGSDQGGRGRRVQPENPHETRVSACVRLGVGRNKCRGVGVPSGDVVRSKDQRSFQLRAL